MHALYDYLCGQLDDMLKRRAIVVFYDPRCEFEPFFDRELVETETAHNSLHCVLLRDDRTFLARHDGSFLALRNAVEPIVDLDRPQRLIIYLPSVKRDAQASILMELEKSGKHYEPKLKRLARNVLRKRFTDGQIDEMLRPASVGYGDIVSFLRQGEVGSSASVLRTIFDGSQSEALITRWLADDTKDDLIVEKEATVELYKLIASRLGMSLLGNMTVRESRDKVLRYVLVSEFRSDLDCDPPSSVAMILDPPNKEHLERSRDVSERLRRHHGDQYVELAINVESDLALDKARIDAAHLGRIDTFRFEERSLLSYVGELIRVCEYSKALRDRRRDAAVASGWIAMLEGKPSGRPAG